MSSVAIEHPGRSFPTTVGFVTRSGFDVLVSAAAATAIPHAVASVPCVAATSQLAFGSPAACSYGSQSELYGCSLLAKSNLADCSAATKPVAPVAVVRCGSSGSQQELDGHVGWKGLLEISENSGSSGVLGSRTVSDEMDSRLLNDCKIEICCTAHTSPAIRRLVKSVIRGLRACQEPEKAVDGMGGTYFFTNEAGRKVAILKPCDEEPLAPNNPKGYVGRQLGDPGWKPTVRVGEAAMREVAAYLLDHEGWARVPTSVLVRARHTVFCYNSLRNSSQQAGAEQHSAALLPMKLGSLQEFVSHECDTSEMGPGRFCVRDVHRIGILDLRLFNTDRHAGNMLVRTPRCAGASTADMKGRMAAADGQYELIPIDHGFCLPETLEAPYFEWLHWPQTMLPFTEDELQYIRDLDIERDKAILRQELPNLRPESLRVLEVCTTLLQMCAAKGLTLYDIASVMTRPFVDSDEEPSELERICAYARQCVEYAQQMQEDCCLELREEDGEENDDDGCASEHGSDSSAQYSEAFMADMMNDTSTVTDSSGGGSVAVPAPAVSCSQRAMTTGGVGSSSRRSREEDNMLFELEDEDRCGNVYIKAKLENMVCTVDTEPSSHGSPSSSVSMEEQISTNAMSLRAVMPSAGSGSFRKGSGLLGGGAAQVQDGVERSAQMMARSVHVTDGFQLWRKMKASQQAAKRAAVTKGGALMANPSRRVGAHGVLSHAYVCYPPPVAAFSPERMTNCFSLMDEEHWLEFMEVFRAQVASALEQERWRQSNADKNGNIAMSCPRF